jgi:tetratricopeptide (TPR) repeat protein
MTESPFASICNEMAAKFDEADTSHNIEKTKALIDEAEAFLKIHDESAYAPLFYSVGTSKTIVRDAVLKEKSSEKNFYTNPDVVRLHSEAIWYFRHAEELVNQIEETEDAIPWLTGFKIILYVNQGNAFDFCGRKCSAIDYYSKAINLHPFGMALGNIGRCLEHYADLKKAYKYYLEAEQANDVYTYQEAKDMFRKRREALEERFGREILISSTVCKAVKTESVREADYRHWCLANHLFLNTLNDLLEDNPAFMTDSLHITSITTGIEQKDPPFVFEMFDQVKEEYIYSRYLLYEVVNCDYKVHFADKEAHLDDVMNYSTYSIRLEKLKTAFRTVYSLFDRIAFLLNSYLNLGIEEHKVYFNKIWNVLEEKEKQNIAIGALHWINRDFRDKFGDADTPHAKKLKDLRHALEHKFVSVHIFPVEKEVEIGEDYIYRISEAHLIAYTMDLLKLVREALIELTVAIRIEEYQRDDGSEKVAHMELYEYLDDFKR